MKDKVLDMIMPLNVDYVMEQVHVYYSTDLVVLKFNLVRGDNFKHGFIIEHYILELSI